VGIGAHLGDAIAGTIGRNGRLEYTVIGDAVNSAQRIERLTSKLGRPLLVSAELIEAAGPEFRSYFGLLGLHTLDGRQQPKLLFGLADRGDRKRESSALFMRTAPTGS
jgi:adenylate cyclase